MKTYTINVTQRHINTGVRGHVMTCAIGLAMQDAGAAGVFFPVESLPEVAQQFMRDFDEGRAVRPFVFQMDVYN